MYTVYKHTNKANSKVYIGITSQNVNRRWQNGAGYYGTYIGNAISKYGWDGFEHEILAENLTEQQACAMERKLIAQYKSNDKIHGYNIAEGGQVVHGSSDRKGSLNHKSTKIKCFDSNHNFIREYESQNIAAIELGINRKGITKNCLGKTKTYKGYIFEYSDKEYTKPIRTERGKHNNHRTIGVNLVDVKGNVLASFSSIKEASEMFEEDRANGIQKCCSGLLQTYHGRRWCHAN